MGPVDHTSFNQGRLIELGIMRALSRLRATGIDGMSSLEYLSTICFGGGRDASRAEDEKVLIAHNLVLSDGSVTDRVRRVVMREMLR